MAQPRELTKEEKLYQLEKELMKKQANFNKEKAILQQKVELLDLELQEYRER